MMFAASLILLASLALASPLVKRVEDYVDPRIDGGSMLDASAGLGEPLNVIVSANSAPEVLTEDGFLEYSRAVGLWVGSLIRLYVLANLTCLFHQCRGMPWSTSRQPSAS